MVDGPIIGYVRICVDPLGRPQGAILAYFGPEKWSFLKNFIRILRFIWDLGLVSCDNPKDLVFGKKKFFFLNIGFLGGKLGPKMDQNWKFWVRPVVVNIRDFQNVSHGR